MTTGADMRDTTDKTFRDLRPAALDTLADDAHARRRDADLAHAMRATTAPPRRAGRRPVLALAAVTAGAAVTGAVVVTGGNDAPATGPEPTAPVVEDARSVLLASATTVERQPFRPSRYWYTRVIDQESTNRAYDRKGLKPGQRSREVKLPFTYRKLRTQESWTSRTARDRTRTITGIDVRLKFPTPKDEAAWRRAGSPKLMAEEERRRSVNNYDEPIHYTIGARKVPMDELLKLPTDAAKLAAELRRRHRADGERAGGDYPGYVWLTAQDLLGGPITPGTKAALYRVLADLPGVRAAGRATDALGRRGTAITMGAGDFNRRLVIDPVSGNLLADEGGPRDAYGVYLRTQTYARMGWADSLEDRP